MHPPQPWWVRFNGFDDSLHLIFSRPLAYEFSNAFVALCLGKHLSIFYRFGFLYADVVTFELSNAELREAPMIVQVSRLVEGIQLRHTINHSKLLE